MLENKESIRKKMRSIFRVTPASLRHAADQDINEHLNSLTKKNPPSLILGYHPVGHEPDVRPFFYEAMQNGIAIALPTFTDSGMTYRYITSGSIFVESPWGMPEPHSDCTPVSLQEITQHTLMLVPGLAFTLSGERLGRGGGVYDRFISELKKSPATIGICYSSQILASLPTDSWDQKVQTICTEEGIISIF